MNLEKLNLVELDTNEIVSIDGGKPMGFWDYVRSYHNANVSIWTVGYEALQAFALAYGEYVATYPNRNI